MIAAAVVVAALTAGTPFKVTSDTVVQANVSVAWSDGGYDKYLVSWTESSDQDYCTGNADVYCSLLTVDGSGNVAVGAKFSCGSEADDDRALGVEWDPVNDRWGMVKANAVLTGLNCAKMDPHLYTTTPAGSVSASFKMTNLGQHRVGRLAWHMANSSTGTANGWHVVTEMDSADVCRMKMPPILTANPSLDCSNGYTLGLTGNDIEPDIAFRHPTDESLIVFAHDANDPGFDVRGVIVTDNGAADNTLDQGTVFDIATGSAHQRKPRIAFETAGDKGWLVVWERSPDGSAGSWDVYGSFVTPGSPPAPGTPFAITSASGDQRNPDVAYDFRNARFLVVWDEGGAINGAELTDVGGIVVTDVTLASGTTYSRPAISAGGSWLAAFEDSTSADVAAVRVTTDSTVLSASLWGSARAVKDGVEIAFETDGTQVFLAFRVHRRLPGESDEILAELPGEPAANQWLDAGAPLDATWRVEAVRTDGTSLWTEPFGIGSSPNAPASCATAPTEPSILGTGILSALCFLLLRARRASQDVPV